MPGGTGRKVPAFSLLEHRARTLQLLLKALHLGQALHLLLELGSLLRNGLELPGVACYVRVRHLSLQHLGLGQADADNLCQAERRSHPTYCEPFVGFCGLLERLDHKFILQTAPSFTRQQITKQSELRRKLARHVTHHSLAHKVATAKPWPAIVTGMGRPQAGLLRHREVPKHLCRLDELIARR